MPDAASAPPAPAHEPEPESESGREATGSGAPPGAGPVATFGREADLPRLPLPTLAESAERFLGWCAPLLDAEQQAATGRAVAAFLAPGSPAHALQDVLVRRAADPATASWLDPFWRDRYLGRRDRIALNANFFFLFHDAPLGQVARAANLVAAACAFKRLVDTETLAPAMQKDAPLAMDQFRALFSATRIPGERIDTSRVPYSDAAPGPSTQRHIVVLIDGRAYALDVLDQDGTPCPAADVAAGVTAILADAAAAGPGPGVGRLTTLARADWARHRARLVDTDADALDELERGLFCLALEGWAPAGPQEAADALLAGDAANRWFDKSVTLVVFADGTAGFNGEHCHLDGTTIITLLDHLLTTPAAATSAGTAPPHHEIAFRLDDDLTAAAVAAGEDFSAYAAAMATRCLSVDFSAQRAKALQVSPDAFVQLALQVAHRRAKGFTGATYESIATRRFRHGRTEAMRVITPEVVAFVDALVGAAGAEGASGGPTAAAGSSEVATLARSAAQAHVDRARECQAGRAPEQHLWELNLLAAREAMTPPPALYDSPGWRILREDYLSTSAVPSPHIRYWGFGSTSPQCIGVGYAIMPDRFDLYLSTPREVAVAMDRFAAELPRAVAELEALLTPS